MGRAYGKSEDNTDVFRQKVTRKGVTPADRWGYNQNPGQPYETTEFFGPYRTRNVGGNPWLNRGDTWMKVEIQKLEAVPPGTLEWVTEKEKVIERDVSELQ
jgi:hypothetical protein